MGGALGLEVVGSHMATRLGRESIPYEAAVGVEEFSGMVGVVMFPHALMMYISRELTRPIFGSLFPKPEATREGAASGESTY